MILPLGSLRQSSKLHVYYVFCQFFKDNSFAYCTTVYICFGDELSSSLIPEFSWELVLQEKAFPDD